MTRYVISIGGVAVEVSVEGKLLGVVSERFARSPTDATPEVLLAVHQDRPEVPDREPDAVARDAVLWWDGEATWFRLADATAHAVAGTATVGFDPLEAGDDAFGAVDQLAQYALGMALVTSDRMLAHSAALARGGDAMLVVGASGRGKSTVAAAALGGGWDLMSDDLTVVSSRPETGDLWLEGVRRAPRIPQVAVPDDVAGHRDDADARGRWVLPTSVLTTGPRRVVAVITVQPGPGPAGYRVVDPAERPAAVLESLAVPPAGAVVRRHLPMLARLGALPVYALDWSDGTTDGRPDIAGLLDGLWRLIEPTIDSDR